MTARSNFDPLTQSTFLSPFLTTRRNVLLDLLANMLIFPAYVLCVDKFIRLIFTYYQELRPFTFIMAAMAIIPIISISASRVYWRLGFKERKRVFAISIAVILTFLFAEISKTIYLFFLTIGFTFGEFLFRRILARGKLKNPFLDWSFYFLAILCISLLVGIVLWIHYFPSLNAYYKILEWAIYGTITLSIPVPLVLGIQDAWDSYTEDPKNLSFTRKGYKTQVDFKDFKFILRLLWRLLLFLLIIGLFNILRFLNFPEHKFVVAVIGLFVMLVFANPARFLSRQRANIRWVTRWIREDFIRTLVSPGSVSSNPITTITRKISKFLQRNRTWLLYIGIFVFGGAVFPCLLYYYRIERDILNLVKIGSTTFIMFGVFLGIYLLIQNRPKYIVLPFTITEADGDKKLDVVANLIRHAFVDQLHQISLLLNLRQVENLSFRDDHGLSAFVASGSYHELAKQLGSLGSFDVGDIRVPFGLGNIVSSLIQQWAEMQIKGTVQRQEDNTIAVWVEFVYKNGQTIGVDLVILPEDSVEDNYSIQVTDVAYALAVKLVLKLGHHSYIATSYESMRAFLDGLHASYQKNWWYAISRFQKAVHIEEVEHRSFGYGYYHLGALLMSQGEILEGMRYLEHAEAAGPPLAETQYMLALGFYYQHQDELHVNRTLFTDIEFKCQTALLLRPNFPEAYHLLGSAYYQRGRLRERAWTRYLLSGEKDYQFSFIDPISRHYTDDYHKAQNQFLKAIKLYDKALRSLPNDISARATVINEQARLVEDRMAATHRLADVLRCLQLYSEADSYYKEVLVAFPRNNRTLIDRSKTYCLAKNWGRADEFLRNDVFNYPELKWDKSASFYMAWSQLGGVAENANAMKRFIDRWFIHAYERITNRGDTDLSLQNKSRNVEKVWNAVCWLDYALHQYPAYLYRWQQLDWQKTFKKATDWISTYTNSKINTSKQPQKDLRNSANERRNAIYSSSIGDKQWRISQAQYWLAWRVLGSANEEDESTLVEMANDLINNPETNYYYLNDKLLSIEDDQTYPKPNFAFCFRTMRNIRSEYTKLRSKFSLLGTEKSLEKRQNSLRLGAEAYQIWKQVCENDFFSQADASYRPSDPLVNNNASITFGDRWAIDVFADFSLLTIKLLFESKAFEYARDVARDTRKVLTRLITLCEKKCEDPNVLFLGGKVAHYQLSTLYAWEVYAELSIHDDIATKARLKTTGYFPDLDQLDELIRIALSIYSHNPLALFVKAILYKQRGLTHLAADEFTRLANMIAPFNPHKYIRRDFSKSVDLKRPGTNNGKSGKEGVSPELYLLKEKVHGRRHTDSIVNLANIHFELATIYAATDEIQFVASHLNKAISYSTSYDLTSELFLHLAILLTKQEKFQEALAATEEAKDRHQGLSQFGRSTSKCIEPFVLECILTTNIENYSLALEKASRVRSELSRPKFKRRHLGLIDEIRKDYEGLDKYLDRYVAEIGEYIDNKDDESELTKAETGNDDNEQNFPLSTSSYCLQPIALAEVLDIPTLNTQDKQPFDQEIIFASQIIGLLSRDLFEYQLYRCDILNNMAFNWAELNFNLEAAWKDSLDAVSRMSELLGAAFDRPSSIDWDPEKNLISSTGVNDLELKKGRKYDLDLFTKAVTRYEERLAGYMDTLAWVQVRFGSDNLVKENQDTSDEKIEDYLKGAYTLLSEEALLYSSQQADIYYHLARVCVSQIELTWQTLPSDKGMKKKSKAKFALKVSALFRTASLYLQHANKLDPGGNLRLRLKRVQSRLEKYRTEWEIYNQPSKSKSEPPQ